MQLTPLDRNSTLRPTSAEAAAHGANRVVPVEPVNQPGVVDEVHITRTTVREDVTYPNPHEHAGMKGPAGEPAGPDWATQRSGTDKPKDPQEPPISEELIAHLRIMWMASAAAVQLPPNHGDGRESGKQPDGYDITRVSKNEKADRS